MEIESSWKFHADISQFNVNNLEFNQCLFSPDNATFCFSTSNLLKFITSKNSNYVSPPINQTEKITCIANAFSDPWTIAIGTTEGKIIFFNATTKESIDISPLDEPVQFLKMCSFSKSYYTYPVQTFLVQYPEGICVTIDRYSLSQAIKSKSGDRVRPIIWRLSNAKEIRDSVVVNSNINLPIYSEYHQFPAIYTVGKPFISVSSICKKSNDETIFSQAKKSFNKFFKSFFINDYAEEKDASNFESAASEWQLDDDKREGTSLSVDPSGRFIAISDNMFRVIVVDSTFGHIIKVLKGYRDAQTAWFSPSEANQTKNPFLVVYVPTREMIVACTLPNLRTVAAVKVTREGKLFQTIDQNGSYGVNFVYPTGYVAIIKITVVIESGGDDDDDENESFENRHFAMPPLVEIDKNQTIQELQKLLLLKKWTWEEVKNLASTIENERIGGHFVKLLVNSPSVNKSNYDEQCLVEIIDAISEKFNVNGFEGNSRQFFDSCFSSLSANGESELAIYRVLTRKWLEYSKFEKVTVSENDLPQTNLTEKHVGHVKLVIDAVCGDNAPPGFVRPSLKSFLVCPMENALFFFSFLRSAESSVDDIYDAFRFSREDRNVFIYKLLVWIVKAPPAQVLLVQNAVFQFFITKLYKDFAAKQYGKLNVSKNSFQSSALSYFLSY